MKKINFSIGLLLLSTLVIMSSCSGSKQATQTTAQKHYNDDLIEATAPFSEAKYKSDDTYLRARGTATSPNENMAYKTAVRRARADIATTIKGLVQEVATEYTQQYETEENIEFAEKLQSASLSVVDEVLNNVHVVEEKMFRSASTGDITYYVVVETSKEEVAGKLVRRVSNQMKNELDFNEAEFSNFADGKVKEQRDSDRK